MVVSPACHLEDTEAISSASSHTQDASLLPLCHRKAVPDGACSKLSTSRICSGRPQSQERLEWLERLNKVYARRVQSPCDSERPLSSNTGCLEVDAQPDSLCSPELPGCRRDAQAGRLEPQTSSRRARSPRVTDRRENAKSGRVCLDTPLAVAAKWDPCLGVYQENLCVGHQCSHGAKKVVDTQFVHMLGAFHFSKSTQIPSSPSSLPSTPNFQQGEGLLPTEPHSQCLCVASPSSGKEMLTGGADSWGPQQEAPVLIRNAVGEATARSASLTQGSRFLPEPMYLPGARCNLADPPTHQGRQGFLHQPPIHFPGGSTEDPPISRDLSNLKMLAVPVQQQPQGPSLRSPAPVQDQLLPLRKRDPSPLKPRSAPTATSMLPEIKHKPMTADTILQRAATKRQPASVLPLLNSRRRKPVAPVHPTSPQSARQGSCPVSPVSTNSRPKVSSVPAKKSVAPAVHDNMEWGGWPSPSSPHTLSPCSGPPARFSSSGDSSTFAPWGGRKYAGDVLPSRKSEGTGGLMKATLQEDGKAPGTTDKPTQVPKQDQPQEQPRVNSQLSARPNSRFTSPLRQGSPCRQERREADLHGATRRTTPTQREADQNRLARGTTSCGRCTNTKGRQMSDHPDRGQPVKHHSSQADLPASNKSKPAGQVSPYHLQRPRAFHHSGGTETAPRRGLPPVSPSRTAGVPADARRPIKNGPLAGVYQHGVLTSPGRPSEATALYSTRRISRQVSVASEIEDMLPSHGEWQGWGPHEEESLLRVGWGLDKSVHGAEQAEQADDENEGGKGPPLDEEVYPPSEEPCLAAGKTSGTEGEKNSRGMNESRDDDGDAGLQGMFWAPKEAQDIGNPPLPSCTDPNAMDSGRCLLHTSGTMALSSSHESLRQWGTPALKGLRPGPAGWLAVTEPVEGPPGGMLPLDLIDQLIPAIASPHSHGLLVGATPEGSSLHPGARSEPHGVTVSIAHPAMNTMTVSTKTLDVVYDVALGYFYNKESDTYYKLIT